MVPGDCCNRGHAPVPNNLPADYGSKKEKRALEKHPRTGVHTRTMKIIKPWHDGFPLQSLSEVRRGSAVFTTMLTGTDPLWGRPVGGSGVHRK
jgi:hypothetical protein